MRGAALLAFSCLLTLSGCGEHFPFGEKLLPASYGPPFGSAQYRPHHAANPAGAERHAEFLAEERHTYSSHEACNAAMQRLLAGPGEHHGPVAISSIETVGHHVAGEVTHEYRCSSYVMTRRAWRSAAHGEAEAEAHAPAH